MMSSTSRENDLNRLRALMAMTVANGCAEEEELSAARMVARTIEHLDSSAEAAAADVEKPSAEPSWAARERESSEYQTLLEKTTLETMLKAALQELALGHIATVIPVRRLDRGQPFDRVPCANVLRPHFQSILRGAGGSRMARAILDGALEDLIQDGALPESLDIPRGR
jgi:hypothetical protein